MNTFLLSRYWFTFCYHNSERVSPTHTALYFYILELGNQLNWKPTFGIPAYYVMSHIGIASFKTFSNTFHDLAEFGFIEIKKMSTNQHTTTQISITKETAIPSRVFNSGSVKITKALTAAFTKAIPWQLPEQVTIDKLINLKTLKLINENASLVNLKLKDWIDSENSNESGPKIKIQFSEPTEMEIRDYLFEKATTWSNEKVNSEASKFLNHYQSNGWRIGKNKMKDWKATANNWISRSDEFNNTKSITNGSRTEKNSNGRTGRMANEDMERLVNGEFPDINI